MYFVIPPLLHRVLINKYKDPDPVPIVVEATDLLWLPLSTVPRYRTVPSFGVQVLRQRRIVAADSSPERIVAEILVRKIPEDQQAIGKAYSRTFRYFISM